MKALSILGTSSSAGKSWMATALCAWLRGLGVRVSRLVRPRAGDPPAFVLVRLGFGPGRERKRRALTLKTSTGADTAEARRIYEGKPRTGGPGRNRDRA